MLSLENIESELSYAYLHAVASQTGVSCTLGNRHDDAAGIDATLRVSGPPLHPESIFTDFFVDVQLKATRVEPRSTSTHYSHDLSPKNYNELRSTNRALPYILVVLFLPGDQNTWLEHSEECLLSRRCAYWVSLFGAPESTNAKKQVIYIPRQNLLSADGLRALLTRFSRMEAIPYVT